MSVLSVEPDHQRGPLIAVDQTRRADAHDASMPALSGGDDAVPFVGVRVDLLDGCSRHGALELLALVVEALDLQAPGARFLQGLGAQQRERDGRVAESPCGVQPGRQTEGDIDSRYVGPQADLGGFSQSDHTGASLIGGQSVEAHADQRAIVGVKRRDVGDGSQGHQIEPLTKIEICLRCARTAAASESASPALHRPLKGKPHSGRCGLRKAIACSGSGGTRW